MNYVFPSLPANNILNWSNRGVSWCNFNTRTRKRLRISVGKSWFRVIQPTVSCVVVFNVRVSSEDCRFES